MKKLLIAIALASLVLRASAQATNPPSTFDGVVSANNPSLWLNFNDATRAFKDSVSQAVFTGNGSVSLTVNTMPTAYTGSQTTGWSNVLRGVTLYAGNITAINVCYYTTPAAGQTLTVFTTSTPTSGTIQAVATMTVAAVSGCQTLTAPANFTAIPTTAGEGVGFYAATGIEPAKGTGGGSTSNGQGTAVPVVGGGVPGTGQGNSFGFTVVVSNSYTSSTVTPQQPGFDSTNNSNLSAQFPYNGWAAAPNNTLGSAMEWNTPWTMMLHVNKLNWDKSASKYVLASKGDTGTGGPYWQLYLQQNTGNVAASQLCFARSGYTAPLSVGQSWCTAKYFDSMPNGFNYNIVVEDAGNGTLGAVSIWVNGLAQSLGAGASSLYSFGSVTAAITSAGTGFTASTAFTSIGGGAACVVTGTAAETSGALSSVSLSANSGCTSAPTIVLTSPTGAGAVITATAYPMTMNAPTFPLMVPGYVNTGVFYGPGGTDTAQGALNLDEYAEFPGNLSSTAIGQLFYQTKFYQQIVNTATPKPVVIVDNDTTDDPDNTFALQMAIGLHKAGLITLAGVVADDWGSGGASLWRQMLDSAGLNDVPLSVPTVNPGTYGYSSTLLAQYNASTPLPYTAWESSTTMYRSIFAAYPTTPIKVMLGDSNWQAFAAFMQSAADGISSLTGLQMIARDGTNGGAAYGQGGLWDSSANGAYVAANNQTLPIIWIGGTPMNAGPGGLATRTANDPLWIYQNAQGSDIRQCYDCLMVEAAVSSLFDFGVSVTYSGGTGYANSTPFTLSGGGANCQGSGIMTASSGVPNGIQFSWGVTAVGAYSGVGSGCTSAPTVNLTGATGTGVTLTATPTPCGEYTESGGVVQAYVTTACANQYITPGSFHTNQTPVSGAVMTWFINSLVDPPPVGRPHR